MERKIALWASNGSDTFETFEISRQLNRIYVADDLPF